MSRTISEAEIASRSKCADAIRKLWDAIAAFTDERGELTGAEWVWVVHQILGRFASINLQVERTGGTVEDSVEDAP